jgi:asparagine synthase (glutamine-hydrolysing)
MCGICGIVTPARSGARISPERLVRMRDVLTHRGPDDEGSWFGPGVALGHRRLSIVDIEGGHQPMETEDGRFVLVYNGEIYNHPALKAELETAGEQYRTRCDTETLLRIFARDGVDGVRRLRGMFAFGVWDTVERRLTLVRDRLGIKPLYYVHTPDGSLYFGSEIKALVAAGAVTPELNYGALGDYLANHAPSGEETLFAGVRRVPPAHALVWEDGRVRLERYWRLSFAKPAQQLPDDQLVDRFVELFRESVRLRLMADVPLGTFLSGGIDSTAITAVMSELVDEPVRTFSVAFAEREANELEYARMAAKAYGTDHHEVLLSPERFFELLPSMIWHEDEPIAHPSSIALFAVARLAADHVKVVLTGEGSDELLGGYGRYWKTLLNLRLGRAYHAATLPAVRSAILRAVGGAAGASRTGQRLARTFLARQPDLRHLYFDNFAVFGLDRQAGLFTAEASARASDPDPYAALQALADASDAGNVLDTLLDVDIQSYLHELLMKQDQMSMAASIESRVPFLDHELVEFAAALPAHLKVRGRVTKRVLREGLGPMLPEAINSRPKAGFPVPIGAWFRGPFRPLVHELVLSDRARTRGIFRPDAVGEMVAAHEAGRADHAQRLWSLMNLELWHRLYVDGEAAAVEPAPRAAAV